MKTSIKNRELKVFEWSSDEARTTTAKLCNMICLKCRPYEKLPLVFEPNLEIQKMITLLCNMIYLVSSICCRRTCLYNLSKS